MKKNLVIMKALFLMAICIVISTAKVNACIKHKDIKPDSTMKMSSTTSFGNGIQLDLNADGTNDCSFTWFWFSGFGWQMSITGDTTAISYMIEQDTLQFGEKILTPTAANSIIDSTKNWGNSVFGNVISDSTKLNFAGLGDRYIGVKLRVNGKTHFGWVLVSFDSAASKMELYVKAYAYNNTPNMPIVAGDTGTSIDSIIVFGKGGQDTLVNTNTLQMETSITPTGAYSKELAWSVDDTTLATISPTGLLTAKKVGAVKVTVSDSCSGKSDDTTITIKPLPVGISKQIMMSNTIKVYPNPVTDVLHIEKETGDGYKEAVLYSIEGRQLKNFSFMNNILDIDMKELPSGLYFMVLVNNQTEMREVVRVQKQ